MTENRHPLVSDYLARLRTEAIRLDAHDASELLADIEAHLAEATPAGTPEADVRNALDRLGSPSELVDAALGGDQRPHTQPPATPAGSGWAEAGAVLGLVGAEVLAVAWPLAIPLWLLGLVCLVVSKRWDAGLKMQGFFAVGLGMPIAWFLVVSAGYASTVCTSQATSGGGESATTCTSSLPQGSGYAVSALIIGFLIFQLITLRKMARAARG